MKKRTFAISTLITIAFLVMSFAGLIPITVKGFIGEYTIQPGVGCVYAARCDHLVTPPALNDAWTGCGIAAYYYSANRYGYADYYFQRGFGGPIMWPHTWTTDGPLYCEYQVDASFTTYLDYNLPVWGYGQWPAYYQTWQYRVTPIAPILGGYTVGSYAYSWFKDYNNPNNRVFIFSIISENDMYAANPHWRSG